MGQPSLEQYQTGCGRYYTVFKTKHSIDLKDNICINRASDGGTLYNELNSFVRIGCVESHGTCQDADICSRIAVLEIALVTLRNGDGKKGEQW